MPCVTFDQRLYVKAFEIVSSMKMRIFVCLGGFHQLMSFLGLIGKVMEGLGLGTALEIVYTPVTVSHLFSGKAYARAVRGHLLCASALQLILLKEVWDSLNSNQQNELKNIYESEEPSCLANGDISIELMVWLSVKKKELIEASRTSALWVSYITYISILQEFIRAEKTSNWNLQVCTTKSMLNLFAATGHYSYAKSCWLYLQSLSDLEQNHPEIYQRFLEDAI